MRRSNLGILCAAGLSLCAPVGSAVAANSVGHLERCTRWGYIDQSEHFGTSNTCAQSVAVRFWPQSSPKFVERVLHAGETFDTGLTRSEIGSGWWMFTTCPVGFESDVPFIPGNRDILIPSRYRCARK